MSYDSYLSALSLVEKQPKLFRWLFFNALKWYNLPLGEKHRNDIRQMIITAFEVNQLKWIPVEERLPEFGQDVMVYSKVDGRKVATRDFYEPVHGCSEWKDEYSSDVYDVTHWMPLPNPPKA